MSDAYITAYWRTATYGTMEEAIVSAILPSIPVIVDYDIQAIANELIVPVEVNGTIRYVINDDVDFHGTINSAYVGE